MEINDKLTCKKTIYSFDEKKSKFNFFKKAIFKSGKKYEISNIHIYTTHGCTACPIGGQVNVQINYTKIYNINGHEFDEILLDKFFNSKKEERRLKLKKLRINE